MQQEQYFQAIGIVKGDIVLHSDGLLKLSVMYKAQVGRSRQLVQKLIPLQAGLGRSHIYNALKKDVQRNGGANRRLLVYPKIVHLPDRSVDWTTKFIVAGFESSQQESPPIFNQLDDFHFLISGFYQFIPVCRVPCLSVMRNATQESIQRAKSIDNKTIKQKMCKGTHIPVDFVKFQIEPPFKFSPRNPSTKTRKFIKVKCYYEPENDLFMVTHRSKLISAAEAPKYLSVAKKKKYNTSEKPKRNASPKPRKKVTPSPKTVRA